MKKVRRFLATAMSLVLLCGSLPQGVGSAGETATEEAVSVQEIESRIFSVEPLTAQRVREMWAVPETVSDEEIESLVAESQSHPVWDLLFLPPPLHDDPRFMGWDSGVHTDFAFCGGPWAVTAGWRGCRDPELYPHLEITYQNDSPPYGTLNWGTKDSNYPYHDPSDGSIIYIRNLNTGVTIKRQHIGLSCSPWWGCSNAFGDPAHMWGTWDVTGLPINEAQTVRINGEDVDSSGFPLKEYDSRTYVPYHPALFEKLGYTIRQGTEKSDYLWFARGDSDMVVYAFALWGAPDEANGFVVLDAAPMPHKNVPVRFDESSGLFYVDLEKLQDEGLLGAHRIGWNDGVLEIDIYTGWEIPEAADPWFSACEAHGYMPDFMDMCPVNEFLYRMWYVRFLEDDVYRRKWLADPGAEGMLKFLDYTFSVMGLHPSEANGDWWGDARPKYQLDLKGGGSRFPEFFNTDVVRWIEADYSGIDAAWDSFDLEVTEMVNVFFIGYGVYEGVAAFTWALNPIRNYLVQRAIEREVAFMTKEAEAKAPQLLEAAQRQGLGHGYPLVFPTTKGAPGNGTYGVIRYVQDTKLPAFEYQCKSLNCPAIQPIKGFDRPTGKFYVVLEQGLYEGSPYYDRIASVNGAPRILDAKFGYQLFSDPSKGKLYPVEWFEDVMNSTARQIERNILISEEYGFGKPMLFINNQKAIVGIDNWIKNNRPDLVGKFEFFVQTGTGSPVPPLPPPGYPVLP